MSKKKKKNETLSNKEIKYNRSNYNKISKYRNNCQRMKNKCSKIHLGW